MGVGVIGLIMAVQIFCLLVMSAALRKMSAAAKSFYESQKKLNDLQNARLSKLEEAARVPFSPRRDN